MAEQQRDNILENKKQTLPISREGATDNKESPAIPQETKESSKEKKEEKKSVPKIMKKDEAVARCLNMHASKKHCMYLCSFMKGKSIDLAIEQLQEVTAMKRAIPFKGEIPHRRGMMSGRYPRKASQQMINVLKALKGNVLANGMDLDKTRITWASASWASRPAKRDNMRFKRTYVVLKAREVTLPEKAMQEVKA